MAEPKRKAREKRAVGADPLAGLDSERLAGLLVERGGGRAQKSAPAEERPRRARTGRRPVAMPLPEQLELATTPFEQPAEPVRAKKQRTGRATPRRTPARPPEQMVPDESAVAAVDEPAAPVTAAVDERAAPPILAVSAAPASAQPAPELDEPFELPAVDASDPESAIQGARTLAARGRSTQAVALLERALDGPARTSMVAVELGRAYVRAGAFKEAEGAFQRAMRLDPEDGDAHLEMGILLSKKGLYSNAIPVLREGLVMECDQARGHYYLGICLNQLDRIDDAEDAFEQAVAADPGFDRAWYQLGIVWDRKGDIDRAREMYRRARLVAAKARG